VPLDQTSGDLRYMKMIKRETGSSTITPSCPEYYQFQRKNSEASPGIRPRSKCAMSPHDLSLTEQLRCSRRPYPFALHLDRQIVNRGTLSLLRFCFGIIRQYASRSSVPFLEIAVYRIESCSFPIGQGTQVVASRDEEGHITRTVFLIEKFSVLLFESLECGVVLSLCVQGFISHQLQSKRDRIRNAGGVGSRHPASQPYLQALEINSLQIEGHDSML